MNVGLAMLISLGMLFLGYLLYGRWVGRRLGVDPNRPTPAHTQYDGVDYAPARPLLLFGHHFSAIAAAGPIVGPTLALLYGFLPVWLWVVLGVIFIGAVHDMTALFVSIREGGRSIAEVARRTLGPVGYFFFLSFALFLCILVAAAFADLTAVALTSHYPAAELGIQPGQTILRTRTLDGKPHVMIGGIASTSAIVMTFLAPFIGWLVYRRHASTGLASILAAAGAVGSILVGLYWPLQLNPKLWILIIMLYILAAAYVPIWLIIQPRDYVNVQILYLGLLSLIAGAIGLGLAGHRVEAPLLRVTPDVVVRLGELWPFLFITVACGAASGAHGLIATGTTSKQVANEKHVPIVGYGGMLMESVLALCVIFAVLGGLGYTKYMEITWPVQGRGNAPLAFALGVGYTLFKGLHIPLIYGTLFGIVLLEGFLVTTIDAVMRLSRYLIEEFWRVLWGDRVPGLLRLRFINSLIPVVLTAGLAFSRGYTRIWPLFGASNQLLAALTLVVATVWLVQKARTYWFAILPAVFMSGTTITALALTVLRRFQMHDYLLGFTAFLLLGLALGFIVQSVRFFVTRGRGALTWGPASR